MSIEAFVMRPDIPDEYFLAECLNTHDFRVDELKAICKELGELSSGRSKIEFANRIMAYIGQIAQRREPTARVIARQFVRRPRSWLSLKIGSVAERPRLANIHELFFGQGEEQWYGPLSNSDDKAEIQWYVRPVFIDHWITGTDDHGPQKHIIRWLCWARVGSGVVSLHWNGFTRTPDRVHIHPDGSQIRSQFEYWAYIPRLFLELETILRARVEYPDLCALTLNDMWDRYQSTDGFSWRDTNIRARSGGVAFSAHTGSVEDFDATGIRELAATIQRGIAFDLKRLHRPELTENTLVEASILRTLIKDFNPHSHGFELRRDNALLYNGHCYFGVRKNSNTQDSFPHVRLLGLAERDEIHQLELLVSHLGGGGNATPSGTTIPLPLEP